MSAQQRQQRVQELFTQTHLPDPPAIARRYPHQISGGQCQRVVIAMALAMRPALLIADEPTTALDVTTQAQILSLVRELKEVHGHGILFITHDFGVVAEIADRIAVMQAGRLVEVGTAEQILNEPREAYTRKLVGSVPSLVPKHRRSTDSSEAPLLRIERLNKTYGGKVTALKDVSPLAAAGPHPGDRGRIRLGQEHAGQGRDPPGAMRRRSGAGARRRLHGLEGRRPGPGPAHHPDDLPGPVRARSTRGTRWATSSPAPAS